MFAAGGVEFHAIDVALSAMARGDWSPFERRLSEGLACAAWEAERGQPSTVDLDAAATQFRYARDLISADEINAWLARHAISTDEWTEFLHRDLLRQDPPAPLDDILELHQPSAARLIEIAVVEGVCSGTFEQHEESFRRRVALAHQTAGATALHRDHGVPEDAAARLIHGHAHWLSILPGADTLQRAGRILAIDAAYEAAVHGLLTQAALLEAIDHHRLEWRLVETQTVLFASEHAAREGLLCITGDEMSLEDVAALSRRRVDRQTRLVEDLEADHADVLSTAEIGTLIGPTAVADGFQISRVVGCTPPSLADPRVAARARAAVLDRAAVLAVRAQAALASPRRVETL